MKPIAIPRPTDPELAKQWDEAKRALITRDERRRIRDAVTEFYNKPDLDPDCCVGDRSQCRCAPERGGWSASDA